MSSQLKSLATQINLEQIAADLNEQAVIRAQQFLADLPINCDAPEFAASCDIALRRVYEMHSFLQDVVRGVDNRDRVSAWLARNAR